MKSKRRAIFQQFLTFLGVVFLFLTACHPKINRFKKGQQHGLWITYTDSAKTKIQTRGKFRNGIQVGKWIYNSPDGIKERIEIYRGKKIKIRHFYENGKIAVKGKAKIILEKRKLHFYYYGPWYYYLRNGELEKIGTFEKGNLIKEDFKVKTGSDMYDSLNLELIHLDKDFVKYRDTLSKTENKFGKNSSEYIYLKHLKQQNDSSIYARIEKIVKRFGFPEKAYVGENNGVIFFIIGFAPWKIKENYLEVFRAAADKKDISPRDFTYFEDKYWLAKSGYQIYGTQYKFDKNYKEIYYPVKDLSQMNDRRVKMGLEAVNLLEYAEFR